MDSAVNLGVTMKTGDRRLCICHHCRQRVFRCRGDAEANGTDERKGSPYGFGLEIGDDHGLRTVGHGGGDPGFAAYVIRYPDRALAVAVLCNLDNIGRVRRVRTSRRRERSRGRCRRPRRHGILDPHERRAESDLLPCEAMKPIPSFLPRNLPCAAGFTIDGSCLASSQGI